ncbi:N-acetylmuramic acid 6-phosphate etherase [Cystobacter fuscus DSM 2262]|uniref:N-acetylmuramic acid 6-phosphate etherase n=1 Tax=Cystobacter fuscus (strain ATCC 25194 / DSM 2262 / NBRC 100088 / M29) TaxID=1242864 RepID=S9QFX0_CYSF2|nr:N-acetylmuramic acid 6-phosphate etherase [Cystobacter fuscus]EPX60199.1 N-acetylmuramic acid 6-phosphate etherase [Cystobacter fuscus DSM 2262]
MVQQSNLIPVDPGEATLMKETEAAARRFQGLDGWGTAEVLETLWSGQSRAMAACLPALPALGRAVDAARERLAGTQGRLIYAGAGSAGALAALDALELPGTFGWPSTRLSVLLAGGLDLARGLDAGAEDDAGTGRARVAELHPGPADVVLGVSASGGSAFTVGVVEEARRRGALTVAIASVEGSPLVAAAEHAVVVHTGAEVIAGSTRLGAGTAQKVVLNLFSTAVMTGLGLVFDNMMCNVRPDNAKLRQRCVTIISRIAGVGEPAAADALARHGDIPRAVLGLAGLSPADADHALVRSGGNLRAALESASKEKGEPCPR